MTDDARQENRIVESWHSNAHPWANAIAGKQVASREAVTNQAIVEAVLGVGPHSLIDIGCGEGWFCRALAQLGTQCLGVDAIPALLEIARKAGGDFQHCAYESLTTTDFGQRFDCAVSNFALLGKQSTEAVFDALPTLLKPGGHFFVQTLHPETACGDLPYTDGWREGSWAGFSDDFRQPAPWYFRTTESWEALFPKFDLELLERREPRHPRTGDKQSLILIGRLQTHT